MAEARRRDFSVRQRHIIERPRLLEMLSKADANLILLVAPAGYGKTTLARQWLANEEGFRIWIRAQDARSAVGVAATVAAACSEDAPGFGTRLTQRLGSEALALDAATAAQLLALDVATAAPISLVIDDLHLIDGPDLAALVAAVVSAGCRVIVGSRTQPTLAAPRSVVYGEALVIGVEELRMNEQEVAEVLERGGRRPMDDEVASLTGWPALVGLAATSRARSRGADRRPVYEFFAADVLQDIPKRRRQGLRTLAVSPRTFSGLNEALHISASTIADAVERGLMLWLSTNSAEFHPLFRAYLLSTLDDAERMENARLAVRAALAVGETDIAFDVIREQGLADLVPALIETSLRRELARGRVDRIEEWIQAFPDLHHPMVALAGAEVAFRRGDLAHAEGAAARAAADIGEDHHLASRALSTAARAAHLGDRTDAALEYFARAKDASVDAGDRTAAVWGEFTVAFEAEAPNVDDLHTAVLALNDSMLTARADLHIARYTDIRRGLTIDARAAPLAARITDPVSRAGYLNVLANNLVVAGRYRDALCIVDMQKREADELRLSFVVGHVALNRAAANIGIRRFDVASVELDAFDIPDDTPWVRENLRLVAARLGLSRQEFDQVADHLSISPSPEVAPALHGEYLALSALSAALGGNRTKALDLATKAERTSRYVEVAVLPPIARLLVGRTSAERRAAKARLRLGLLTSGAADAVVTAYRARPELLEVMAQDEALRATIAGIVGEANDRELAESVGADLTPAAEQSTPLTPR